jgi:alanine racemase
VTDIPDVTSGDEVVLIGSMGDETITVEELGARSGRFNYEFVCDLGKRIPRVYKRDGAIIGSLDHFEE